ncbi:hypothetical protein AB0P12_21400 [Streptomyces subrutilus]|uniref:Uncharacterized protein n=1 Tax=Streptomyces subrutilus TaxID=36818 RepID=A0A5P2ULF8_9ACTN|nr:hypothetical protein [Streptomyces subrutilus]QEU79165.1 hypothetical protein CP968_13355 [Streptomyces subrutilus]WSJ31646.1 hypothetical protein OG479_21470 [Streptomyces subrutilus]GGZ52363.1 hypothetical protein GCM10010371_09770 [Streptomyces subrutilus]
MNRFAARIASGAITTLLVVGGAGAAHADGAGTPDARPPAVASGQSATPGGETAPVSPLTNDWG